MPEDGSIPVIQSTGSSAKRYRDLRVPLERAADRALLVLTSVALLVTMALVAHKSCPRLQRFIDRNSVMPPRRVFTAAELAAHDGSQPGQSIWLAVLGEVFDVSSGEKHYGKGMPYNLFAGRDASRAYANLQLRDADNDALDGLSPKEILAVRNWLQTYTTSDKYVHLGVLAGRYYDAYGRKTREWHDVEASIRQAERESRLKDEAMKEITNCNSRWRQGEGYTRWCTGGLVPRELKMPGSAGTRCVCAPTDVASERADMKALPGCDESAAECRSSS